jgi:hypothetical protein
MFECVHATVIQHRMALFEEPSGVYGRFCFSALKTARKEFMRGNASDD